jgi:acetyl-CoA synthetase
MPERISPPPDATRNTHCTAAQYEALYRRSLEDPDGFWAEQAKRIDWVKAPTRIGNWSYDPVDIKWYEDGVLNLCHNCVDRHLAARSSDPAILWEGDEPGFTRTLTLRRAPCRSRADGRTA